jgi:hypothetical protein
MPCPEILQTLALATEKAEDERPRCAIPALLTLNAEQDPKS